MGGPEIALFGEKHSHRTRVVQEIGVHTCVLLLCLSYYHTIWRAYNRAHYITICISVQKKKIHWFVENAIHQ